MQYTTLYIELLREAIPGDIWLYSDIIQTIWIWFIPPPPPPQWVQSNERKKIEVLFIAWIWTFPKGGERGGVFDPNQNLWRNFFFYLIFEISKREEGWGVDPNPNVLKNFSKLYFLDYRINAQNTNRKGGHMCKYLQLFGLCHNSTLLTTSQPEKAILCFT